MPQSTNEKRVRIVHNFARWTALSALRSGSPVKSRKQVYNLIDKHADLQILFDPPTPITQSEFDEWHEKTASAFGYAERNITVGWATKIINVYLKTRVYLAKEGREGLIGAIHPPIDTDLLRALKTEFPQHSWKIDRIKAIQSYVGDYMPFVQECRFLANEQGCLPIELEYYWQMGG
jgi:hypothetical protein